MKLRSLTLLTSTFLLSFLTPATLRAVDFQEEIRPILNKKCFKCHTGPKAKGKLRMDSEDTFGKRIGGEDDPVIIPGKPAESLLAIKAGLPRTDTDAMPPPAARERGAEPMTTGELNLVKQWISEGASFEKGGATMTSAEPGSDSNEVHTWTNFEGKTLKAAYIGVDGSNVLLKMEDGSQIPYPYDKLSPESQELAKKLYADSQ